jgi:hypothetical protein
MTDGQRVRDDIASTLQRLDHAELLELVADLVKIYVIEGGAPSVVDASATSSLAPGDLAPTFARVIADLKARLQLPELDYFRIDGDRVTVTVGDQTLALERPATRRRAPAEPTVRPPAAPRRDERVPPPPGERSRFLEVD